jgi:hypothetical protein
MSAQAAHASAGHRAGSGGGLAPRPSAQALLGPGHPLGRAIATTRLLVEQSLVVLSLAIASLAAAVAGVPGGPAAIAACVVVQTGLASALFVAAATRRERVLDLIAEGRDRLPLAAVQRERERLLDARHRIAPRRLARRAAPRRAAPAAYRPPLYAPRVLAAVAPISPEPLPSCGARRPRSQESR